ncbi:MAG: S1 family peptidase [Proteobacteria bacterium]|nr:S1 family peptidase [Pseudomonadota bacterium]
MGHRRLTNVQSRLRILTAAALSMTCLLGSVGCKYVQKFEKHLPDRPELPELPDLPDLPHGPNLPDLPKLPKLPHGLFGSKSSETKVVGGYVDYISSPAVIGLLIKLPGDGTSTCTGAVVREDLVLTAAHCVIDTKATEILPFFNLSDQSHDPFRNRKLSTKTYIVFPDYDPTNVQTSWGSDVAFVVFPKGTFSDYPHLKIATEVVKKSDSVTLIGYGQTGIRDKKSNPDMKRYHGTNIVENIIAEAAGSICLDTKAVSAATAGLGQGDSGGPLLNAKNEIIGVAHANSFVLPENADEPTNSYISETNKLVSIYTSVFDPQVKAFIAAVMNELSPTDATVKGLKATPTTYGTVATSAPTPVPNSPPTPLPTPPPVLTVGLECKNNKFCKAGWGWLAKGESGCTAAVAEWNVNKNGCSCNCR